jgi:2-hydroxychromene-2-carboxylate isomerase
MSKGYFINKDTGIECCSNYKQNIFNSHWLSDEELTEPDTTYYWRSILSIIGEVDDSYSRTVAETAEVKTKNKSVEYPNIKHINLFELPYHSGKTYELEFLPHSSSLVAIKIDNQYYAIPKPVNVLRLPVRVSFKYHRTLYKGFFKDLINLDDYDCPVYIGDDKEEEDKSYTSHK